MNFKKELVAVLNKTITELSYDEILQGIEIPPNSQMGDFAFPCFRLAKTMKKSPNAIAEELLGKIVKPDFVCEIKTTAAYINFYVDKAFFADQVMSEVIEKKSEYGKADIGKGRNIVIDYSSPNIAKPFHVGHLRSTVIGNALYNIYNFLGYNSVGINHLGDWGTQFGKLIVAYKKWGNKKDVEEKGIEELTRIYVMFHEEAEKDASLEDEGRYWLLKMQEGDEEALSLWKWFNDISLEEFNRIYKRLNIHFDYYTGESFYNDKMDGVVKELKEKDLLVKSEGAMVVDLEDSKMPPCLILRSDGGTLYPTRDIAAAIYRKKEFDFEKCFIITAIDQNLHFAQWFKVIEKMGYSWAKDLVHIPFGLVSLESGKLSTRKGHVVLMDDLLNEAVKKTVDIIEEKNPDLASKQEIAEQVGIGAIIFNDLYNSRIKDVLFSWDKMLSFDGETGPYVQYTHARASSVLGRAGVEYVNPLFSNVDFSALTDESSVETIKLIYNFPDKIVEAANKYEPFIVTRHLVDLSQAFNKFYHDNQVLSSEDSIKNARLVLVYCVKTILAEGLKLLGISTPDKM